MIAKPVVDLLEDELEEFLLLRRLRVEDLVDETALDQLVGRDALAHDERLVGLCDPHPLHETPAGAALGHETEAGEGG